MDVRKGDGSTVVSQRHMQTAVSGHCWQGPDCLQSLGKPAKPVETSPLQFGPSCSSWGCSSEWGKGGKKLKFSSLTLLGQNFCAVPAHNFATLARCSGPPQPALPRAPQKGPLCAQGPVQMKPLMVGVWVWVSLFSWQSGLGQNWSHQNNFYKIVFKTIENMFMMANSRALYFNFIN